MSDQLTNKAIETLCNEILKAVDVKTKRICSQMIKKSKSEASSNVIQNSQVGVKEVAVMTTEEFNAMTTEMAKQLYKSGVRLIIEQK